MKKIMSKTEVAKKIRDFFEDVENKTPSEIKKMKKLAMGYNLPLKDKKRTFCKNCFHAYTEPKIRIKNGFKVVTCSKCNNVSRWKIK